MTGLALMYAGALTLAGCGSNGTTNTNATDQGVTVPTTAPTSSASGGPSAVTVDVQAGEYFFKSSVTTFNVGVPYHFVVRNVGDIEHELMLVQPIAAGAMSMEDMDMMAVAHIEDSDLRAHQTATIDVTFTNVYPAGTLEMACHIEQHYQNGMYLPIVVTS